MVGTITIPAVIPGSRFWTHEYVICGIAGLVVFVVALVGLRELSPRLRDQLMVTMQDRVLIEARAKGIDLAAALKNPFRQLLKADIVVSALAISLMLLIYYTAVGFATILFQTVFGFTTQQANGLGNWNWGFNVIAVIGIGIISDKLRVRKPFMIFGAVLAAFMTVVYLNQIGHHPSYYTLAIIIAVLSLGLGIAYTPWMASFTETVEDRNPALTATGLAIWGWIIRIVIAVSFLILPHVVTSVTPLVNYGGTLVGYAKQYPVLNFAGSHPDVIATAQRYSTQLGFAGTHPDIVALAQKDQKQIAEAQEFAPEIAVLSAHPALFTKLATYKNANKIPPALLNAAIKAAGGGAKGLSVLSTISANKVPINDVVAHASDLQKIQPFAAQLTALAAVPTASIDLVQPYAKQLAALQAIPPKVLAFVNAHSGPVSAANDQTDGQWRTWYWFCFDGIILFLLSVPILRGRWRPRDARRDEAAHEAMVAAELEAMHVPVSAD